MRSESIITALVGFVLGAIVGAALALLFAPMSGKELQYRIRKESELQAQKARTEWMQGVNALNARVDGIKAQLSRS